jgi:neutral ceramidase
LFGANINRSPTSYLLNPENERGQYADEGDTDKNMLLLKLAADDGANVGVISWFSVHGTSMNASNLVSDRPMYRFHYF